MDLAIVVPSRKRAHNMPLIRELLPSAFICIDEREIDDYIQFVPKERLVLHPPMEGLPRVMNWMKDNFQEKILVEVDDDFVGVKVNTGSQRFITNSEEILAIIENGARACSDLELTTFCWSRTPNTTVIKPDIRPIVPTQSVCNAFGVMGAARNRNYNSDFLGRADVDWTLKTLLEDRCVYADIRFFFDCGRVFGGRGGNVGIVSPQQFENASRGLKHKWGKSLSFKAPGYVKQRDVTAIHIGVKRTNKTAQK